MRKKLATIHVVKVSKGTWFLYFTVRDHNTGKMKPFKIYRGFTEKIEKKERERYGEELKQIYIEKLKAGWSPLNDEESIG
ncbi:MAG: hypothetical protein NTZ33_06135 [Bacteroidetes bacterium]|nr:hypothetical protein [Bacteroidota bacterium]